MEKFDIQPVSFLEMIDRIVGARRNITFESNLLVIELVPMDYLHFHFTSYAVFLRQFLNKFFMKDVLYRLKTIILGPFYLLSYFKSTWTLASTGYNVFRIYILFVYYNSSSFSDFTESILE